MPTSSTLFCALFLENLGKKFLIFFAHFAGLCSDFDNELSSLLACDLQKNGQIDFFSSRSIFLTYQNRRQRYLYCAEIQLRTQIARGSL
jgi:hypothetical protein